MTQHDKVRACCGRCFDDSLQDFKRHVAAAVVTSDNTALATMTTANILQLFEIPQGGGGSGGSSSGSGTDGDALGVGKRASALLAELGDLWSATQYDDLAPQGIL